MIVSSSTEITEYSAKSRVENSFSVASFLLLTVLSWSLLSVDSHVTRVDPAYQAMAPLTFLETHFEAAKRQFKSKSDAAILFIHWKLVSLGFKCAGLIPEEEPEKQSLENLSELLPEGWNNDQSNYRIRYVRESTPFNLAVIRTGRAGNYTLVAALLNVEAESVQSFVINVTDEITDDHQTFSKCYKDLGQLNERLETVLNLPFKHGGKGKGAQHKPTRDECTAVIRHILEEQLPNAGFTDDDIRRLVNAICRPSGEGRVPGSRPNPPPRFPEPDFPVVPPPRGLIDPLGGRPLGPVGPIGRSDLDPIGIGGGIPLGPGMGPGIAGPSGGGMLFDPFGRGRHRQPGIPGNLPPGAVPPGARFDPTGPVAPDELFPGFHGNRGKGPSGRGKPSGSRPGAGPDPDHMSPPGYDDMFS